MRFRRTTHGKVVLKVVLLGDHDVGKTTLYRAMLPFHPSATLRGMLREPSVAVLKLSLWDGDVKGTVQVVCVYRCEYGV